MASQTRTPRQRQGDGLVPLMVRVTPALRTAIHQAAAEAIGGPVSESAIVREVLEHYFRDDLDE